MNNKGLIAEVDEKKETYDRGCELIKRSLYKRLWMNKKRPIPEVVDEYKETHTRGCGRIKIHPYQRL